MYREDIDTLKSILYAISGLVYLNENNQRIFGKAEKIETYSLILQKYADHEKIGHIFEKMCRLLSNLVYKNLHLVEIYLKYSIHTLIFKIFVSLA